MTRRPAANEVRRPTQGGRTRSKLKSSLVSVKRFSRPPQRKRLERSRRPRSVRGSARRPRWTLRRRGGDLGCSVTGTPMKL